MSIDILLTVAAALAAGVIVVGIVLAGETLSAEDEEDL